MKDDHIRSVMKGATWRLTGTLDTIILSLLFTGQIGKALKIGVVELFTKIVLFYLHERAWMRLMLGVETKVQDGMMIHCERHHRSLIKGLSWRIVGSLDTFWIALFINRDSEQAMLIASYIAITEVVTKLALYWLHERIWMKVEWGKSRNISVAEGVESV